MTAAAIAESGPGDVALEAGTGRLYRDAAALVGSSLVAAVCGMAFWVVAAHLIQPARFGIQTALLSLMTAPALVIAAGVGDAFTALLPSGEYHRGSILDAGYRVVLFMAVPAAVVAGVVAVTVLPATRGSVVAGATVAAGLVVWSLFAVQDSALTGLRRAIWLPFENGAVGVVKTLLLPGMVALAMPVLWSAMLPAVLAVGIIYPLLRYLVRSDRVEAPQTPAQRRATGRVVSSFARQTTLSVALTLGSLTLLPFAVTALAGPVQGALFTLSISMVAVLDFVSAGVGMSLVVQASTRPQDAGRLARSALLRAGALICVGAAALALLSPLVLPLLNPAYVRLRAHDLVLVLTATSVLRVLFVVWSAYQQSRRQMRPVIALNAAAASVLYVTLPIACHRSGALGAAYALGAAQLVLSGGAVGHVLLRRAARNRSTP